MDVAVRVVERVLQEDANHVGPIHVEA